jgi:phage-related minor tail protein
VAEATQSLSENAGQKLQGAFGSWIDSAVEGTFRLRDALRELAKDIAKMALKFAANQLFSSFLGGAGGGGGLLGNLLGSLFAKGAAFPQLALPQGVYTQPTYFPMPQGGPLKRYARGGVLGEAGAEAVLPLRRLPSGRLGVEGGGTEVVINNYSGEAVSRRNRQLGDKEIIEIAIGQMEERVARGGNSTSRSMQQAFGLRRGR